MINTLHAVTFCGCTVVVTVETNDAVSVMLLSSVVCTLPKELENAPAPPTPDHWVNFVFEKLYA